MKYLKIIMLLAAVPLLAVPVAPQQEDGPGGRVFFARLTGFQETPMSLASPARGTFIARVSDDESSVTYRLRYQGFPTQVNVAHIHLGQRATGGGVTVFLCGGGGRPACTSPDGMIEDTFTADDVIGLPMQDLAPNDLPTLLKAMRVGATYANIHTMAHGGGEIRGQIRPFRGRGESDEPNQSE